MHPDAVVDFWFAELTPAQWWRVDAALDETIRTRFGAVHRAAGAGELACWRETAHGRLAEVIVLDQFSRNLYRGSAAAFAGDGMALVLAQEAVRAGADQALPVARRAFFYLPWMHSESLRLHDEALRLFSAPGMEGSLQAEHQHRAILERFGRYPHRNAALGRVSTPEEEAFLLQPGSRF